MIRQALRPKNMFRVASLDGGEQLWLPNPDQSSGDNLIATLVNSGRNAEAVVVAQKIGRDQGKSNLAWNFLEVEEWEPILRFWDRNFFFNLYYYDRVAGNFIARTYYIGDRKDRPYNVDVNGRPTAYVDCTANMVDTGEGS